MVPLLRDRPERVRDGPSNNMLQGPYVAGSYCVRKACSTCDQSIVEPTPIDPEKVVEFAGSERYPGIKALSARNPTSVATGTESSPEMLKSNVVVEELPSRETGEPAMSKPSSKLLVLVQYAREPSPVFEVPKVSQ